MKPQLRGYVLGLLMQLVVGQSTSFGANDPKPGLKETPRQRLSLYLKADPFRGDNCPGLLNMLGENALADLRYVNQVGARLARSYDGILGDDLIKIISPLNYCALTTPGSIKLPSTPYAPAA